MRIRKRWLLLFVVPLAILGAYFGWGAILASEYETRPWKSRETTRKNALLALGVGVLMRRRKRAA